MRGLLVAALMSLPYCDAAIDACGHSALPMLRDNRTVGLVRIQKTGSTTLVALWDEVRKKRHANPAWDEWTHGNHHDWHQVRAGEGFANARTRREPVDVVVVNLRDPVDRVLSEYYFCVLKLNCVQQDQWDYAHRGRRETSVALLRERLLAHLNGSRSLGLGEWVEWPGNPAHERQSHYVSGFRYGEFRSGESLDDARAHLCDPDAVVLLSIDLPDESRALARHELGWDLTATDWTRVRPAGKSRYVAAPDHLPPEPPREDVDDAMRAEIRRRNPRDTALYDLARRVVLSRAAMLPRGAVVGA